MNYQKIKTNEYDIHIINNNKFHTIDCRIYFTESVNKELVTYRNALINVLTYATKVYNTKAKLTKRCQDLYSLNPLASSNRNGNYLTTKFSISTVNSKYIENNNLIDNLLLLKEIILNPLVTDNKFNKKYFNITKKELENETKTIIEEPRLYANINLVKLISKSSNIISSYSDLNILDKMSEESLYQSYLDMLHHSKIDIFISGNFTNTKEIIKVIQDNFIFNNKCHLLDNPVIVHSDESKLAIKEETKDYQQSKLAIGYKIYQATDYENRYVSFIFNNLLGGGSNSLLMRLVREEKSLCYYINSYNSRFDNILLINSGINKENYDLVIKLTDKVMDNIINGKFTNKDLNDAKMEIVYNLSNIFLSNSSIIEYYYGISLYHSDEIKKKTELFKNVSKEDIIKYAKKIKKAGIYFLKGDL